MSPLRNWCCAHAGLLVGAVEYLLFAVGLYAALFAAAEVEPVVSFAGKWVAIEKTSGDALAIGASYAELAIRAEREGWADRVVFRFFDSSPVLGAAPVPGVAYVDDPELRAAMLHADACRCMFCHPHGL